MDYPLIGTPEPQHSNHGNGGTVGSNDNNAGPSNDRGKNIAAIIIDPDVLDCFIYCEPLTIPVFQKFDSASSVAARLVHNLYTTIEQQRFDLEKLSFTTYPGEQKMVSREQERAALHEKLQLLHSVTDSRVVIHCIIF